jgi:hypothetical protein
MGELILEPTTTAQWQRLVKEASSNAAHTLDEDLESYLVFLLARFCEETSALERVMALEYLQGLAATGRIRQERLRDVGDQCLLFAGLFPHMARKRMVRIGYFVELGRGAYQQLSDALSHSAARLYGDLSAAFVVLMDVLQSMRALQARACLSPLEAIELLQDTQSARALANLRRYSDAQPVIVATSTRRH